MSRKSPMDALFLEEQAFLDSTAWLTCSSVAKLTADLSHDLGTRTHFGS